jgi:hypothetical protein
MALLTGLTDQGLEVPVQVTPAGVLVAEGLPGKDGADGNNGAAEVGAGFVILQGAGAARVMGCWGTVAGSDTAFVTITFPRPYLSPPSVTVVDAGKGAFEGVAGYLWMLKDVPSTTSAEVMVIRMASGSAENAPAPAGRPGCWMAWGPVA